MRLKRAQTMAKVWKDHTLVDPQEWLEECLLAHELDTLKIQFKEMQHG